MSGVRKVAVVGCRPAESGSSGWDTWVSILQDVMKFMPALAAEGGDIVVVSGGARGVDQIAAKMAKQMGLGLVEYLPDYPKYGRSAPLERNTLIVRHADEVHAWPAPWSRGTWDTVQKARAAGKPVVVHEPWKKGARGGASGGASEDEEG